MAKSSKQQVHDYIMAGVTSKAPPGKSNLNQRLWAIFYWQQLLEISDKSCKDAWKAAVDDGVIEKDEVLRELGAGEHILADSDHFSVVVKVSKPRNNFDRELFVTTVAKKFKLDVAKLEAIAESCMREGNPSLTKRVLEAAS